MPTPLTSVNPRDGRELGTVPAHSPHDVQRAFAAAAACHDDPRLSDPLRRADALRRAAAGLRERGDELGEIFLAESGLPEARATGELTRTTAQLEAFATTVEDGDHLDVIIDHADPEAAGGPRPDLRRMLVAIGPVAVFGASNFPFAFGVAGGDTVSALAAGCPVVVKGHPSQPVLNARVAEILIAAVHDAGLPEGTFASVQGADLALGQAMVDAPQAAAVAFTGSLAGGRALFDQAAARPVPIPVYAEMGSVNPMVITETVARGAGAELAEQITGSLSAAAGQLCTKPGVVLLPDSDAGRAVARDIAERLAATAPPIMLNRRLLDSFQSGVRGLTERDDVQALTPTPVSDPPGCQQAPIALSTSADAFIADSALRDEVFGPLGLFVHYAGDEQLLAAIDTLDGQLTATVRADESVDGALLARLVPRLVSRVGRILFTGVPTGVAVSWATQHGGPYPATTAPGTTSVGMTAARRFLRPVTYQNAPAGLLPPALLDSNPLGLWRRVDGELTRGPA